MLILIAQFIGIAATVLLKFVVLIFLRNVFFAAFFRKRPGAANLMGIALECWNLGLSIGFILVRAYKLVTLTLFFIGRIDVPFLAPAMGDVGPIGMYLYGRCVSINLD